MAAPLSKEQIEKTERRVMAKAAEDPAFSEKLRTGQIQFAVIPGEDKSRIAIVDVTIPANIERFNSYQMFRTPQEAEHFTAGFGNEPTRSGGLETFVERAVTPRYQYQTHDPIRNRTRSAVSDAALDAVSDLRYGALPAVAAGLTGPAGAMAINALPAVATKAIDAGRDPELQETWPSIVGTSLAVGAGAAANKALSESAVRKRQLKKIIADKLGIPVEQVTDNMVESVRANYEPRREYKGPYGESMAGVQLKNEIAQQLGIKPEEVSDDFMKLVRTPLETPGLENRPYTFGDWQKQPLADFDNQFDAKEAPVKFKRPPMVHAGGTGSKVMKRGETPKLNANQWDAIARRFMADAGIPNANPNDVIAFIKEAWLRPQSQYGVDFYSTKATAQGMPKNVWTGKKANEPNPVAQQFYRENAYFEDPAMNEAYTKAMAEYKARMQKLSGKQKTPIVTQKKFDRYGKPLLPSDYQKTGTYDIHLGFVKFGDEVPRIPMRGPLRAAATVLPMAAQAAAPYVVKALTKEDTDGR